jgi:hypothetical protein
MSGTKIRTSSEKKSKHSIESKGIGISAEYIRPSPVKIRGDYF